MPKMKTNRSAKKRFTVTGSGKVKYKKANKSHILTKKAPKRKRQLRNNETLAKGDARRAKRMIIQGG
jgi:large subunit ribosomal protein L35